MDRIDETFSFFVSVNYSTKAQSHTSMICLSR